MAEKTKGGAYENPIYIDPAGSIRAVAKTIGGLGDDATNFANKFTEQEEKNKKQEEQEIQDKSDKAELDLQSNIIDAKTKTEKPKFGDNIFQSTRPKFTLDGNGDKSGNASMNRMTSNTKNFYDPNHSLFDE